ncbi:MAG: energy transducer TonB [Dokdonella sp.]
MATRTQSSLSPLSWQRIVALSSTFMLHVGAVAVVAIPIAAPLVRVLPNVVPTAVFDDRPPPAVLPEPPGPVPPKHILPTHKTTTPAPIATSVPTATTTVAIDSPMAIPASTGEPAAGISSSISDAPAGETRTLAYDGALKLRYPPMSMRQREQGTVLLRVLVDASGGVQRIEIERSSGHAQLDAAARDAVQRARFKPVLRDGQAIPAWGIVPIEFRLNRA